MFYVRAISGGTEPYQIGIIRSKRITDPVSALSNIEAQTELSPRSQTSPAIAAYQKSINPESPRRRVLFASELMSKGVVCIDQNAKLIDVAEVFAKRRFRHIPVLNSAGDLVGILSDRDLLRFSREKTWELEPVSRIMIHPVLVATSDTEIREIARAMFEERVGCMPIVGSDGKLVGIITRSDVLRTILVQAPLELWR